MKQKTIQQFTVFRFPQILKNSIIIINMLNIITDLDPNRQITDSGLSKKHKPSNKRKSVMKIGEGGEQYQPDPKEARKAGIYLQKDPVTRGHWHISEIKIYYELLIRHKQALQSQSVIEKRNVFLLLSKALINRNLEQCRTHHNKLYQRCGKSIHNTIEFVRQKIEAKSRKTKEQCSIIGNQQLKVQHSFRTTISSQKNMEEQSGIIIQMDQLIFW